MVTYSFFDPFLFAVSVLVCTLAFIDFLLGKEGQKRLREVVGNWWVYLEYSTYYGLGAADAKKLHNSFRKLLGPTISLRFWILAFAITCVLLFIVLYVLASLFNGSFTSYVLETLADIFAIISTHTDIFVINAVLPIVALIVTMYFLRLMASTSALWPLVLLTISDVVILLSLIMLTVVTVQSHRTWDVFNFDNIFVMAIWMSGGIVSLIPTLLHILLMVLFIGSKLSAPFLKKPINLILLRLHESEKGVLSLIGLAAGTLAKLVQEGLKLL